MRRLILLGVALGIIFSTAFGFAASVSLTPARVTVSSRTLTSPTLSIVLSDGVQTPAGSLTVAAGTDVTALATLDGETATASGNFTHKVYTDNTCTTLLAGADPGPAKSIQALDPSSEPVEITVSGIYYWQASYNGDANNQPAKSPCSALTVTAAAAHHLAFIQQPTTATAGSAISPAITVQVLDQYNNLRTSDNTTQVDIAILSNPGGGALSGTASLPATLGVATFSSLSIDKAGSGYTLLASSTPIPTGSATSTAFDINPGTAAKFVITGSSSQEAGSTNNLTITAQDTFGNLATGYTGSKMLIFSGASSTASPIVHPTVAGVNFGSATGVTFTSGTATISGAGAMKLYVVESAVIAAKSVDNVIQTAVPDRLTVNVTPGSLGELKLELSGPQIVGVPFTGVNTLTALDTYGNTVTNFNAATTNVTITANSPLTGVVSGLGSAGNGVLNQMTNFTLGVADLTALGMTYTGNAATGSFKASAAGPITDDSSSIVINVGAASRLVITGSSIQTAGTANNLTITARDAGGNTVTSYTGLKTLTFSGASASTNPVMNPVVTPASGAGVAFGSNTMITFAAGVASVSGVQNGAMTLYRTEVVTISVTDGSISAIGADGLAVTVNDAGASKLAFAQQPSNAVEDTPMALPVIVRIEDAYGNLVTSSATITLAIGTNPGVSTPSCTGGTSKPATLGVASFSSCYLNNPGVDYTLTATSPPLTSATSVMFTITAS